MALAVLRGEPHAPAAAADQLLEPGGRFDAVAVTAAARRRVAVHAQLHRVDAGDADAADLARAVALDVDVDRVAVGDERDLAGPERAGGAPARAGHALA